MLSDRERTCCSALFTAYKSHRIFPCWITSNLSLHFQGLCICAAPQIFLILGMGQKASLLGILIVSGVNLLATMFAIYAVDR